MFLLSVWMSNSTFIAGQCLNASHSNDSHGAVLCHVKGTSAKQISSLFHYFGLFLHLWKTCLHEASFKSYLSERGQFHTKVQILILQPCSLEELTLHEKWHSLQKCALWLSVIAAGRRKKYRE